MKLTNTSKLALATFAILAVLMWLLPKLAFALLMAGVLTAVAWMVHRNWKTLFPPKPTPMHIVDEPWETEGKWAVPGTEGSISAAPKPPST